MQERSKARLVTAPPCFPHTFDCIVSPYYYLSSQSTIQKTRRQAHIHNLQHYSHHTMPSTEAPQVSSAPVLEATNGVVDDTSPDALQRRNSLEKHLQMRPDEQDLKDRHILLDTTAAPALQARQAELERQRRTDNLKKVSGDFCLWWGVSPYG